MQFRPVYKINRSRTSDSWFACLICMVITKKASVRKKRSLFEVWFHFDDKFLDSPITVLCLTIFPNLSSFANSFKRHMKIVHHTLFDVWKILNKMFTTTNFSLLHYKFDRAQRMMISSKVLKFNALTVNHNPSMKPISRCT